MTSLSPRKTGSHGSTDLGDLRRGNLSLVLEAIREHSGLARAEIADRTGLARASVTTLAADLIDVGMVEERAPAQSVTPGRPRVPLFIAPFPFCIVVIEIDIDVVIVEASDLSGTVIVENRALHARATKDPDQVLGLAADLATKIINLLSAAGHRIVEVAIVIGAPIDRGGRVIEFPELEWESMDLAALVASRLATFDGPVAVYNEASMSTLAEARFQRQARSSPVRDLVFLGSRTGISGGAISGGTLLEGSRGLALTPGHIVVRPGGTACRCGRRGCLLAEAGPTAVLSNTGLDQVVTLKGMNFALEQLVVNAQVGHPETMTELRRVGGLLSEVMGQLQAVLDPEIIVLGGYWAQVLPSLEIEAPPHVEVVATPLGERSPRIGALETVVARVIQNPLETARPFVDSNSHNQ